MISGPGMKYQHARQTTFFLHTQRQLCLKRVNVIADICLAHELYYIDDRFDRYNANLFWLDANPPR
jgi:hypothetical protein